jgi:hypothetical protein
MSFAHRYSVGLVESAVVTKTAGLAAKPSKPLLHLGIWLPDLGSNQGPTD